MRTDAARKDQRHSTVTVMTTVNSTETVVTITGEGKLHGLLYNILCYKIRYFWIKYYGREIRKKMGNFFACFDINSTGRLCMHTDAFCCLIVLIG